jgi:hypothetical protein
MSAPTRRAAAAVFAVCAHALVAIPVGAHGGVTGAQDVLQDYGVLIFLLAVVLIGAGVLTWVLLAPQPELPDSPEGETTSS